MLVFSMSLSPFSEVWTSRLARLSSRPSDGELGPEEYSSFGGGDAERLVLELMRVLLLVLLWIGRMLFLRGVNRISSSAPSGPPGSRSIRAARFKSLGWGVW